MRKFMAILMAGCLLITSIGITAFAQEETTVFVKAQDFKDNKGSWNIVPPESGAFVEILKSPISKLELAKPARVTIEIPRDAAYSVWTRSRDFVGDTSPEGTPITTGTRFFHLAISGTKFETVLGDHGVDGWDWEKVGTIDLKKGEVLIEVIDSSAYFARLEGIILTTDKSLALPQTKEEMTAMILKCPASVVASANPILPVATVTPTVGSADEIVFKESAVYYVYTPKTFENTLGSWMVTDQDTKGSVLNTILIGAINGSGNAANPATAKVGFPETGFYKIMVHSRDFASAAGSRPFQLKIGENEPMTFGAHGVDGWHWEDSGALPIFAGEYDLKLIDFNGNYARMDMIIITNDLELTVGDSIDNFERLAKKEYVLGSVGEKNEEADPKRCADEIAVKLNGSYMNFDVEPVLMNGRTMVPFRAIFEALGCAVEWDEENQTAVGSRNGKTIRLPIGYNIATVAGKGIALDQAAVLKEGRTLVPLRFVSESLGATIDWSEKTKTATILAVVPKAAFWFNNHSFEELGTWILESNVDGAFEGNALRGLVPNVSNATLADADPSKAKPAIANFHVSKEGQYKLWIRSRDFANNQQGSRFFEIGVNNQRIDKKLGAHGATGFQWVEAGVVTLSQGENTIELYDTSGFYARCDAIFLTQDLSFTPPESYSGLLSLATPYDPLGDVDLSFPRYATEQAKPSHSIEIANEDTKVVFYTVQTSKGQVIQNEIYSNYGGEWIKTKTRQEELGYIVIAADQAEKQHPNQDMYVFKTMFDVGGTQKSYLGSDLYKSGHILWFIPKEVEKLSDSTIKLTFGENERAALEVIWELEQENKAPLVSMDLDIKKDGYYTLGGWEGSEMTYEGFEFALAPYRVQGKRVHEAACLLTEQHLFTPMGTYTLGENNPYHQGVEITKGVAVEPSWIPLRWVFIDNGIFGINMKGTSNNHRAAAFSPVMGSGESKMTSGSSYHFKYRVISMVGGWFDTYKFVAQDLFGVHDYRQNVNSSLNTTIFNTRKLMMDDVYSGWDTGDKAHYNIEGINVTSSANPMQAMQVYLLTEDKVVLTRRAIPTIANLLTRRDLHFNSGSNFGGMSYWSFPDLPQSVGTPIAGYNLNVIGGMYEMTRGGVPYLYSYGLEKGKTSVTNSYGSVAPFSNNLNLYKYTGDKEYLNKAIEQADEYLETVVYATQESLISWPSFIYISYYPNLSSLVDIYEVTKEQRYLDAARYTAQWLATCLWVPGINGEYKNSPITANDMQEIKDRFVWGREDNGSMWWAKDKQFRIGRPEGDLSNTESNKNITDLTGEVPGWIPSRVGLGIEQASTFGRSANIIMSSWVGDFLKIAQYAGEEYFSDTARNAIIGRFSNYSGYYQNGFYTFQQTQNYPYDGPDYTGLYWHHIPPFLAMLEDFLINMTTYWSDGNISFPSLRQQGYAYFNSNQYGFAPGRFYEQSDMWLWLDENVLDTGNMQIDWLGARKDGVVGFALLNESDQDITTTVTLGEKILGAKSYNGFAVVYDKDQNKTQAEVKSGMFEIRIPAKSLRAVVIEIDEVRAPAYSKMSADLNSTVSLANTVKEHENGKAYALQMSPENYYAYVYVTNKPLEVESVTIKYKIGTGEEKSQTTNVYPYEFIIEVEDVSKDFSYSLELKETNGATKSVAGSTISPAKR